MNTNKVKKSIAVALFGVMTLSLVGTSAAIAEASPRYTADVPRTMDVRTSYGDSIEVTQLAARRKKPRRQGTRRVPSRLPQLLVPSLLRLLQRIPKAYNLFR